MSHIYFFNGFFVKDIISIPMTAPIATDKMYCNGFVITPITKIPPWGAGSPQWNAIDNAPATADPIIHGGKIWIGSPAANGIAPSVMKDNPIT